MPIGLHRICLFTGVALCAAAAMPAWAEPQVTLTISGSTAEIRAILDYIDVLKKGSIEVDAEDPLKVRVHSVGAGVNTFGTTDGGTGDAAPADPPPPPPPALALMNAEAAPDFVAPGEAMVVKVNVIDRDKLVDTLALTIAGTTFTTDLFDNGRGGDEASADGLWTARFVVPMDLPEGEHFLAITAYGMSGTPLRVPDASGNPETLTVKVPIQVAKPSR